MSKQWTYTDDEIDGLMLSVGHPSSWRIEQERERRRLDLSETYSGVPVADALRLQQIDSQLAGNPLIDGAVDREQLWRERGSILARFEPEHAEMVRQTGPLALSEEAPAASPPNRRQVTPPSAPTAASEEEIDAAYNSLAAQSGGALRPLPARDAERTQLVECRAQRRYSDAEVAQARFVRFAWPDAMSLDERAAAQQGDEQAERSRYREELRDFSERVDVQRREIERDTLNKIIRKRRRQGRSLVGAIQEADRITGRTAH